MKSTFCLVVKRKGSTTTYAPQPNGNLQPVRERADSALTITYDEEERRLPVSGKVSYHRAFRMLRQDTGLRMAVIDASAETGAIYGAEEGRAAAHGGPTLPLTYLVDLALKGDPRSKDGEPLLVAVHFGDTEKGGAPLLVIGLNGDRGMVLHDLVPSVADFDTTVSNILAAMVASNQLRGLAFDPRQTSRNEDAKRLEQAFRRDRVVKLPLPDLVAIAQAAKTFPREPVYRGVRQSTVARCVLGSGALMLSSTLTFACWAEWSRRTVIGETLDTERRMEEQREAVRAQLLDRLSGLAARVSLDVPSLFSLAEEVAASGGRVALNATLDTARMTLTVPVSRDQLAPGSDRRSALAARDAAILLAGLRAAAPTGWSPQPIELSGDMHAWVVSFTSVPVGRDLLDLVGAGGSPVATPMGAGATGDQGPARSAGAAPIGRP